MQRRRLLTSLALAAPGLTACAVFGSTTPEEPPMSSTPDAYGTQELGRFDSPWAAAFVPTTPYLAVTLKGGAIVLRDMTDGTLIDVAGVPEVLNEGQGGLGDIAVAPGYDNDRVRDIYLTWAEAGPGSTAGAVMGRERLTIRATGAVLENLEILWRQQPKVMGRNHYSHRLLFSPDGAYLFLSSGERNQGEPAQDLGNNLGKVLRLTPDGKPAPGNPFADRAGVSAEIWSYGHRNILGLAFDADGRLWESEMGPKGGDEVNLIEPGKNYGWPKASNGSNYDGTDIPDHRPGDGFEPPKVFWNPSISPGSLMIYQGAAFPQWKGDAFLGALGGTALWRVALDGPNAAKGDEWDTGSRIRAVVEGPDGFIYLLEDGAQARLIQVRPT